MNRSMVLHETADLAIRRFDHPPHEVHCDPEREVAERWAIAFVQSGTFTIRAGRRRQSLESGSVFITRPGLEFHCSHHETCPTDVCVSVGFAAPTDADVEQAWAPSRWIVRSSATPRLAYVNARLRTAVATHDAFEMERWALASLSALHDDATRRDERGAYRARTPDVDAVVSTCAAIERDPTTRRCIAERAREVGLTGTRLTHAFRRYAGVSPHQYVMRCRLESASGFLDEGCGVSDSCYRSGFENLSHFCRSFQRAFGVRASHWTTLDVRERRRKVQDLRNRLA